MKGVEQFIHEHSSKSSISSNAFSYVYCTTPYLGNCPLKSDRIQSSEQYNPVSGTHHTSINVHLYHLEYIIVKILVQTWVIK